MLEKLLGHCLLCIKTFMKSITFETLIETMTEASASSTAIDKIIGTIKIQDDDGNWTYLYLLYFDSSAFIEEPYSLNDTMYVLIYDSFLEDVTLEYFTLKFFRDQYLDFCEDIYWDTSSTGKPWWLIAYQHHLELHHTKILMKFLLMLETVNCNIFDDMFENFCTVSGYSSINRNWRQEELISLLQQKVSALSDECDRLRNPIRKNEEDLPF